jgi:hypothetical protein
MAKKGMLNIHPILLIVLAVVLVTSIWWIYLWLEGLVPAIQGYSGVAGIFIVAILLIIWRRR